GFIGSPPMNFFKGSIRQEGGQAWFIEDNNTAAPVRIALDDRLSRLAAAHAGKVLVFGIRPEDVEDAETNGTTNPTAAEVTVEVSEPMGAETYLYLNTQAHSFIARVRPTDRYDAGQKVKVAFNLAKAHLFDATTEQALA